MRVETSDRAMMTTINGDEVIDEEMIEGMIMTEEINAIEDAREAVAPVLQERRDQIVEGETRIHCK